MIGLQAPFDISYQFPFVTGILAECFETHESGALTLHSDYLPSDFLFKRV